MSLLDDTLKILDQMPSDVGIAAELRCGRDVENWIRGLPSGPPSALLFGVPVYVDPKMAPNEWKMLDRHGNVVARSDDRRGT